MQSELKSLSKIFAESIFRIPDYQRGYSWQEKHLRDFWNDIEQLHSGQSHYTGVLTLEPVGKSIYGRWNDDQWIIEAKSFVPLYVVDGQQRLTTAIVLMQAILEKAGATALNYTTPEEIRKKFICESKDGGVSRSYIFGYEKDNPSYEFLKQEIFGEQSQNHSVSEETIYTHNLWEAKKFFIEKLKDFSIEQLEVIYTKITQSLQFNIFYIEPNLDVFVTFETMNNRGKPLSHLELLKNRLIYLSTKVNVDAHDRDSLRRTINECWKTIYHYLGKSKARVLQDDVFLRTHFLHYFGSTLPRERPQEDALGDFSVHRFLDEDYFKDYLLEEIFSPKRLRSDADQPLQVEDIFRYAMDIKALVVLYYRISNPAESDFPSVIKVLLEQINRLSNYSGTLLAISVIGEEITIESKQAVLASLERFLFLQKFRSYRFHEVNLMQLAIKLKTGEYQPEEIKRKLDSTCETFLSSDFIDSLSKIGKEVGSGYYGWSPTRYFMFEYEQYLRSRTKASRAELDWNEFSKEEFEIDHKSIEHIYPQSGNPPYWRDRFGKYLVKERNVLRNSIGNLLPVSRPKNSSLGNKSFIEKKGTATHHVGYAYGCLSEVEVSHEAEWTAVSIARRGIRLLEFMEKRWSLKIGEKEDKLKALGLLFVSNKEGISIDSI